MKVTKWINWIEAYDGNGKKLNTDPYEVVTGYTLFDRIGDSIYDELKKAVIRELQENGYHFSGNEHQYADHCVPVIDDKYALEVSFREWGAIMEDAYPDEDYSMYKENMGYCKWSFICLPEFEKDVKLPDQSRGVHDYDLEADEK